MAPESPELAAGGVVWRKRDSSIEVLLAHRPRYDDWAFPKGRIDNSETLIECAYREVVEETGLDIRLGRRLPDINYVKPSGRPKTVGYWAMRFRSGDFVPNAEVDDARWVGLDKAEKMLTYERDRAFVSELPGKWNARPRRLILVRHAHAGRRSEWSGDDDERPLSDQGGRDAESLVAQLAPFDIDRIISSPAARCLQTVKPLARERSVAVTESDDLRETADEASTHMLLDELPKGTTVLCTHRPLMERITSILDIRPSAAPISPKGSLWVVELRKAAVVDAHHFQPIDASA